MAASRQDICAALDRAWRDLPEMTSDFGVLAGRDQLTEDEQRDFMLSLAMTLIWQVSELDQLRPIDEVTFGEAEAEANRALNLAATLRITLEHIDHAGDALCGQWVRRMRTLQVPWSRIGVSMGMSRAGVFKKAHQKGWVEPTDTDADVTS